MYDWRQMTPKERMSLLTHRKDCGYPWHSSPHLNFGPGIYHIAAACFEHKPILGCCAERMAAFQADVVQSIDTDDTQLLAWCILPNHYHVLVRTDDISGVISRLGRLHGRTSFSWNGEENSRGRQVWSGCTDRTMRSERHFWTTMNYVHNNAVHHRYVDRWEDWPFSSASAFVSLTGRPEAEMIWREYPLLDYGRGWDDAMM